MELEYELGGDQYIAPPAGLFYDDGAQSSRPSPRGSGRGADRGGAGREGFRNSDAGREGFRDSGTGREGFRGMEFHRAADWSAQLRAAYAVADPLPPRDPLLPPRPGDPGRECGSTRGYACGHRCNVADPNGIVNGREFSDGTLPQCGSACAKGGACSTGSAGGAAASLISVYGGARCGAGDCGRESMTGSADGVSGACMATSDWVILLVLVFILVTLAAMGGAVVGFLAGALVGGGRGRGSRSANTSG